MSPNPFEVIDFWFGSPASPERGRARKAWFVKDPQFDAEIERRFLELHRAARSGACADWEATPLSALALAVTLDQFPRNLFRGSAETFAADTRALALARRIVETGFDRLLRPVERVFAYLPFEHSEELAAQRRSVALFRALAGEQGEHQALLGGYLDYALRHFDIVARFGRFPHRNAVLGRPSTPEEIAFLALPGSSF